MELSGLVAMKVPPSTMVESSPTSRVDAPDSQTYNHEKKERMSKSLCRFHSLTSNYLRNGRGT